MSFVDQLLSEIHRAEVTELLRRLVQIPTINPPGDVTAAVDACVHVLQAAGFSCRTVQIEESKPNLIAELADGDGPTLCFNAHLDVVPVGERSAWSHDPFAGELVDGRMFGRGVLDDKASVVAQIMAGVALARSAVPLNGRLAINQVADEEIGGPAGAALIVHGRHIVPDYVIVGEPTGNRVCLGERGGGLVRIEVHGRTAHGALPWEGANAVEGMAAVIAAFRTELWPRLQSRTHPYFHHSSASVNKIEGGVKDNVVPDYCAIAIDRRFIPNEDPEVQLAEMRSIAESAVAAIPGLSVTVRFDGEVNWARMSPESSPLAQAMLGANRELGLSTGPTGFSMATDGRFFAAAGYPAIIYGPGDPTVAHIPDEWVDIEDVLQATRAYALAAWSLIGAR
jgi:acetylornithine deacetylase/succinyl-diaminopimelate desuccinylase family protein